MEKLKSLIQFLQRQIDNGLATGSQLERSISLPKNSLSAVLKGHKEMPKKWVPLIEKYKEDCSKITVEHRSIPIPQEPEKPAEQLGNFAMSIPENQIVFPWIKTILDYCKEKSITPEDLIAVHKQSGGFKVGDKVAGGGIVHKITFTPEGTTAHVKPISNFIREQQKKKNGMNL